MYAQRMDTKRKTTVTYLWTTYNDGGEVKKLPLPLMSDSHVKNAHLRMREILAGDNIVAASSEEHSILYSTNVLTTPNTDVKDAQLWCDRFGEELKRRGVRPLRFDKDTYDIDRKDKLVRRALAKKAAKKWK
jgi:hypothetical protein